MLVDAFAVYPEIKSSEGIVNKNWINLLRKSGLDVSLVSAFSRLSVTNGSKVSKLLLILFWLSKLPSRSFLGFSYRIAQKLISPVIQNPNLFMHVWMNIQAKSYRAFLSMRSEAVVWVRILPVSSLENTLRQWHFQKFPLVININDPIALHSLHKPYLQLPDTNDHHLLKQTKDVAQCWTFPSHKLANKIASLYSLDVSRCFVVPHATTDIEHKYTFKEQPATIRFIYTGTFYRSGFSEALKKDLASFAASNTQDVSFTFILSQYDDYSIDWLKSNFEGCTILRGLTHEESLQHLYQADCALVIDGEHHEDLLKGKLTEAISFGIPILAITYPDSAMDSLVTEYGGVCAYHNIESDIFNKISAISTYFQHSDWQQQFLTTRSNTIQKLNEYSIMERTVSINNYALQRFKWVSNKQHTEPTLPELTRWP